MHLDLNDISVVKVAQIYMKSIQGPHCTRGKKGKCQKKSLSRKTQENWEYFQILEKIGNFLILKIKGIAIFAVKFLTICICQISCPYETVAND